MGSFLEVKTIAEDPRAFKMSDFALSLLTMDPRIKAYSLFGDVEEDRGYIPRKKEILISVELPKAEHDIAHMVEMRNQERWTRPDWGMPAVFNTSRMSKDGLFAALSREIRVRAIQLHMCPEEISKPSGFWKNTVFNILNNGEWYHSVKDTLPHKRFRKMKDVESWMEDLRDRTYDSWSLDRIRHEWIIRLDYIRNWMESQSD